ncbi:MAG: VapE domain-containing protein [Synechococcaceae cyanobacterium]|nr:VapE domain-containing protein [Synechococcaceae cyanobacterium]
MSHSDDLRALPTDWRLVRVGPDKAPMAGKGWFDRDDFSGDEAASRRGRKPPAWGLKCGPASGVVVVDLDASGWEKSFQLVTSHPITDLPRTIAWTSGKPGRSGHAFSVDMDWWPALANRRSWENTAGETCWELRGDRCQSVIIGAHPETGSYRWLEGRSPHDIPDPAPAPDWLLEALVVTELPDAGPVVITADDASRAVAMLQCLPAAEFSSYHDWLRVGMALHHTDPGLLSSWVDWSRAMPTFDEPECLAKWESLNTPYKGKPATIRTLHYLAKKYGYREPRRDHAEAPTCNAAPQPAEAGEIITPGTDHSKPITLKPHQILEQLPQRLGTLRLNIRSGEIHSSTAGILNGNQISRQYLQLSNHAAVWNKEATADGITLLASQNQFDPVADYLNGNTSEPLPMEQWQRLDQHLLGVDDPIAASFLPRFLISAVARVFDPGCYVRALPVLIGPQERGKSALGRILFGAGQWVEGIGSQDRDALMKCHTAWGVELAELDGITRRARDQEQLKAFLIETADTFRAPYDRTPEKHARRFVFWGTSNGAPLRDPTGATRYVCIPIPDSKLPLQWAIEHRCSLWARAVEQYRAGISWLNDDEAERQAIAERNANFQEIDPWAEQVAQYLNRAQQEQFLPVKVPALLEHLQVPTERQTNALAKRVADIAVQLGWEHGRRRCAGERQQGLWPMATPTTPWPPLGVAGQTDCAAIDQAPLATPATPIPKELEGIGEGEGELANGIRPHTGRGTFPGFGVAGVARPHPPCSASDVNPPAGVAGGVARQGIKPWEAEAFLIRAEMPDIIAPQIALILEQRGHHGIEGRQIKDLFKAHPLQQEAA